MIRIFPKLFLFVFTLGTCLAFAVETDAQNPSLAEQVFQKHQTILLSEDIQAVLPEVLVELKKPKNQEFLTPVLIKAVLEDPDLLKIIVPEINDDLITLLKQEDSDIRILLSDPDVQTLLQMPDAIDELAHLLEVTKPSLATRIFERYEVLFQRQDIREFLPDVLTALKQPDTQALLRPAMIKLVAENPDLLKIIVPEVDDKFISLLKEDPEVNTFISDPDLHVLLQNPAAIDELAVLLDIETVAVVSIVPASIESPNVGEEFAIAVVITNAQNVRGYRLSVQFDSEALRYVSSQQGTYLSGGVFAAPATIEADQISFVVAAPVKSESTQGVLQTMTFEVVATKASLLSLNDVMLVSSEGIALPVRTEDSEIVEPIPVAVEEREVVEPTPVVVEESEVVEPAPVVVEPAPVVVEPAPVVVEPTPVVVEPTPVAVEESEVVEPAPVAVEPTPVVVEPTPVVVEPTPVVVEPTPVVVEPTPVAVEPTPVETEESEVVEPTPVETEESEVVEPTPVETEDGETVEPTPVETEDEVERSAPAWDVDKDGFVNVLDLVLVASNFGQEGPVPADVNGDSVVNILDLVLVASHLGEYYELP